MTLSYESLLRLLESPPEDNGLRWEISDESWRTGCYPRSVHRHGETLFFIGRDLRGKHLYAVLKSVEDVLTDFADIEEVGVLDRGARLLRLSMNHENAKQIQQRFAFTRPVLLGTSDSFGLGDRLGVAGPGQLRGILGSGFRPILAQQSIRELNRTGREPQDVMDAAVWTVFQEGYHDGFGADADHLKSPADVDRMVAAGFNFFTIDPGDHVINEADILAPAELEDRFKDVPFDEMDTTATELVDRYSGREIGFSSGFSLQPSRDEVLRAAVKYGKSLAHTVTMFRYLKRRYPDHPCEFEMSVDETESVTSPFEHYFVASELKRLDVELISLAPRFVGTFEKGIDFRGDLGEFRREYRKHLEIARHLGGYKLSIHSGSDKFSVYRVIGELKGSPVHVKTAGTSYLEALRTVAQVQPELMREILEYSRKLYETERRSYHVSAVLDNVPQGTALKNSDLERLFDSDDARQVLHVTFGRILTDRAFDGSYLFKERILSVLETYEDQHYANLVKHFQRHVRQFRSTRHQGDDRPRL
ncbi:MAG: tagaturonate epimerase family protein [bacterium]